MADHDGVGALGVQRAVGLVSALRPGELYLRLELQLRVQREDGREVNAGRLNLHDTKSPARPCWPRF